LELCDLDLLTFGLPYRSHTTVSWSRHVHQRGPSQLIVMLISVDLSGRSADRRCCAWRQTDRQTQLL